MSVKFKASIWSLLLLCLSLIFWSQANSKIDIETNILALLPQTEEDPFAEKAFNKFSEKNLNQVVFLVGHKELETSKNFAKRLKTTLQKSKFIDSVDSGVTEQQQRKIAELTFNHRYQLLSPEDAKRLEIGDGEYFTENALQLLFSPLSGSLSQVMLNDPLLFSYRYASQQNSNTPANSKLSDELLIFETSDKFYSLINAQLSVGSFSTELSEELIPQIEKLENEWLQQEPELEVLRTGSMFYASHGMKTAKKEISTIGLGSLIAVLALLIIAFISVRPLLLSSLSLGFGVATGFISVHFIFSEVHVLTLVFGASLIGVAIDYAFHYFSSATHCRSPLGNIFPAISMGLISSIIGYIALFVTPFPGLKQMAIFCIFGLIGAFATVVLLFDAVPLKLSQPRIMLFITEKLLTIATFISKRVRVFLWLIIPISAIALSLSYNKNNDDIRQLQSIPVDLKHQEDTIMAMLNTPAANQFFIVKGKSHQQLLENMQELTNELDVAVSSHLVDGYSSFNQWVPPSKIQNANYQLIKNNFFDNAEPSPFELYLQSGFFDKEQLKLVTKEFLQKEFSTLSLEEWLNSPLGSRLNYLWLDKIEQEYAAVVALNGIKNINSLELIAQDIPHSYFINKVDKVSNLFQSYRHFVNQALIIAIFIIFIFLSIRYGMKLSALIILSPVLAISCALLGLIFLEQSINLFNTLALFLILGIGIDYGLFFAESKTPSRSVVMAIMLSALTTIFSFGLLSLSQTPAIHLFGLTMLIGISSVFIFSLIIGSTITQRAIS